jgi:hypothetical protein
MGLFEAKKVLAIEVLVSCGPTILRYLKMLLPPPPADELSAAHGSSQYQ